MFKIEKQVPSDVEGYTKTVQFNGLQISNPRTIINFNFFYTDASGNKVVMTNKQGKIMTLNTLNPASGSPDEVVMDDLLKALEPVLSNLMDSL